MLWRFEWVSKGLLPLIHLTRLLISGLRFYVEWTQQGLRNGPSSRGFHGRGHDANPRQASSGLKISFLNNNISFQSCVMFLQSTSKTSDWLLFQTPRNGDRASSESSQSPRQDQSRSTPIDVWESRSTDTRWFHDSADSARRQSSIRRYSISPSPHDDLHRHNSISGNS